MSPPRILLCHPFFCWRWISFLIALASAWLPVSRCVAQTLSGAMYAQSLLKLISTSARVEAQPDGLIYLNWEAAALVDAKANALVTPPSEETPVWDGDAIRPSWRIVPSQAGRYRVVITRACPPGSESSATIHFRALSHQGSGTGAVRSFIPPTESWNTYAPFVLGEIDLKAEEYLVEYFPRDWSHPKYLINLRDIRLIPVEGFAKLERQMAPLFKRLGVFETPDLQALRGRAERLRLEREHVLAVQRRSTFTDFANYDDFLSYDRALKQLRTSTVRLEAELKDVLMRESALIPQSVEQRVRGVKLDPQEAQDVKDYLGAYVAVEQAATREYPKRRFSAERETPAVTAPGAESFRPATPLFPTGDLNEMQKQWLNEPLPRVEMRLPQPPDLEKRRAHFHARNSEQRLSDLCRRLAAVLELGTPGLEEFGRLAAAGKSREALEAYRAYFFAKLAHPERFGAHIQNLLPMNPPQRKADQTLILQPHPVLLENALAGVAVVQMANKSLLVGKVGEPGEVLWAPPEPGLPEGVRGLTGGGDDGGLFWGTPEGQDLKRRILFYRGLKPISLGGDWVFTNADFSSSLFYSYAVTGNQAHLARFCAYLDDYTMHAAADMDNSPLNIRAAMDHEPHSVLPTLLCGLRIVLDERPEFARDLDPATLVRLLMYAVEEYAPYNLRLRRSQLANWGIMGLAGQMKVSAFLPEFKALNYFVREAWRLANYSFISYRELDGPCIESWDWGHARTEADFYDSGVPHALLPAGVGDFMQQRYFWDRMRVLERNLLTHVSPQGCFWPDWRARDFINATAAFAKPMWSKTGRIVLEHIKDEPEAQQRMDAILGAISPSTAGPSRASDYAPYAGMSYLRDGWRSDSEYLLMQNVRARSQHLTDAPRTGYNLSKAGLCLVEGLPVAVDRKPENHFYDSTPVGGKTHYAASSQRQVQQSRFHSSERFDFTEALQDAPYARVWDSRKQYGYKDPFGLYLKGADKDPAPIRDVHALRQVLHVRGEGLWLVHDRILAPAGATHEYMQCFKLPVRLYPEGFAERVALLKANACALIEEEEQRRLFRTASPGVDNVSVRLFSREPLHFANRLDPRGEPEHLPSPLDEIGKALSAGRPLQTFMSTNDMVYGESASALPVRPVLARWTGKGSQSLVTALHVLPAVSKLDAVNGNDAREAEQTQGPGGVVGCRIVTHGGAEVWLQCGPETVNSLVCGPLQASAETLLVLRRHGKISGMVLGCQKMMVEGKAVDIPAGDFEFELGSSEKLASVRRIYKPIDTVRILPDQTVFTDTLEVRADIPGQQMSDIELRYTLQPESAFHGKDFDVTRGEEPTLESPLYSGPIRVMESSMLKVRAFRKGLKATPWHCANTETSQTVSAIFRKQAPLPATKAPSAAPGLNYTYTEGHWPTLFAYTGDAAAFAQTAELKSTGVVSSLLDPADLKKLRATNRGYAIRYSGYMKAPSTGVFNFYAPVHLYTPTMDAGYDLRVFIDGQEWWPTPMLHAENRWSVALEAGLHRIEVGYVDYRWKEFRDEYWINWRPEQLWQGTPVLEVSGPDLARQPLPAAWLFR